MTIWSSGYLAVLVGLCCHTSEFVVGDLVPGDMPVVRRTRRTDFNQKNYPLQKPAKMSECQDRPLSLSPLSLSPLSLEYQATAASLRGEEVVAQKTGKKMQA